MSTGKIIQGSAAVLIAFYLLLGIYVVGSDEMGVVLSFGRVIADRVPPGIHYHLPWPLAKATKVKVTAIRRMSIGFEFARQLQNIPPSREESERLTGDMNVISAAAMVQYTIEDPAKYLYSVESPDFLVRKVGEAFLCRKIGTIPVDDLLTVSKAEVELSVRQSLQAFSDSLDAGLLIRSCNLQRIEPPPEVIEAFNEVSRAKANREKTISEAQTYAAELIPRSRGEAQKQVQAAQGRAAAQVSRAVGEVARFDKLLAEYQRGPAILKQRLFWDTVQEILSKARKVIIEQDKGNTLRIVQPAP